MSEVYHPDFGDEHDVAALKLHQETEDILKREYFSKVIDFRAAVIGLLGRHNVVDENGLYWLYYDVPDSDNDGSVKIVSDTNIAVVYINKPCRSNPAITQPHIKIFRTERFRQPGYDDFLITEVTVDDEMDSAYNMGIFRLGPADEGNAYCPVSFVGVFDDKIWFSNARPYTNPDTFVYGQTSCSPTGKYECLTDNEHALNLAYELLNTVMALSPSAQAVNRANPA